MRKKKFLEILNKVIGGIRVEFDPPSGSNPIPINSLRVKESIKNPFYPFDYTILERMQPLPDYKDHKIKSVEWVYPVIIHFMINSKLQNGFSNLGFPVMIIDSKTLYDLCLIDENIAMRWNKTVFDLYKKKHSPEYKEFTALYLKWFEDINLEVENISSLIKEQELPTYLSKWAKDVVNILLKNGEMKHVDIIIKLKDLPSSYNHLTKIFKSPKAKKFFKDEIINNNSYYSLKNPNKFKM